MELWRIYDGEPHSMNVPLRPGDPIGGVFEITREEEQKVKKTSKNRKKNSARNRMKTGESSKKKKNRPKVKVKTTKVVAVVEAAVIDISRVDGGTAVLRYVTLGDGIIREAKLADRRNNPEREELLFEKNIHSDIEEDMRTSQR